MGRARSSLTRHTPPCSLQHAGGGMQCHTKPQPTRAPAPDLLRAAGAHPNPCPCSQRLVDAWRVQGLRSSQQEWQLVAACASHSGGGPCRSSWAAVSAWQRQTARELRMRAQVAMSRFEGAGNSRSTWTASLFCQIGRCVNMWKGKSAQMGAEFQADGSQVGAPDN